MLVVKLYSISVFRTLVTQNVVFVLKLCASSATLYLICLFYWVRGILTVSTANQNSSVRLLSSGFGIIARACNRNTNFNTTALGIPQGSYFFFFFLAFYSKQKGLSGGLGKSCVATVSAG